MTEQDFTPLRGHCTCKAVTYEVHATFLFTHCCHCTWCQRETGAAFALNSIIETFNYKITSQTKPIVSKLPSASGGGQSVARCPDCFVVISSTYGDDESWLTYVKTGTLDDEGKQATKPDIHIFTSTKLLWLDLTSEKERGIPIKQEYYARAEIWPAASNKRFEELLSKREGNRA